MSTHRIKLLSGGCFDFVDMEQSSYTIEDIAHNLSRICRFNGSIEKHYSVAQHSLIVSHVVPEKYALSGLLHDMSESFVGDLCSPLKQLMKEYKKLETKVEKFMFGKMNIPFPMHSSIKLADLQVLAAEIRDLQPHASDWSGLAEIEPYDKKIVPWSADKAKKEFLKRYKELTENK